MATSLRRWASRGCRGCGLRQTVSGRRGWPPRCVSRKAWTRINATECLLYFTLCTPKLTMSTEAPTCRLPVHTSPVRHRPPNPRRRRRRIKSSFQPRVVQVVRQRPGHSRLPGPPDVAADRAVGGLENGPDLPVAPAKAVLQPEYVSNLRATDTSAGPPSFLLAQGSLTSPKETAPTSGHPAPLPTARILRSDGASRWTKCVGMGGRLRSERVDEMNRNQWC